VARDTLSYAAGAGSRRYPSGCPLSREITCSNQYFSEAKVNQTRPTVAATAASTSGSSRKVVVARKHRPTRVWRYGYSRAIRVPYSTQGAVSCQPPSSPKGHDLAQSAGVIKPQRLDRQPLGVDRFSLGSSQLRCNPRMIEGGSTLARFRIDEYELRSPLQPELQRRPHRSDPYATVSHSTPTPARYWHECQSRIIQRSV